MKCYHCNHDMVWKDVHEEDVHIDDTMLVTYVTTNFECQHCPTVAKIVHELPAEYISSYSNTDTETDTDSSADNSTNN